MMKQQLYALLLGALSLISVSLSAQDNREQQADKKYESLAYMDAIKRYENRANKGYVTANLLQNLGNSYYFNGKLAQANVWYAKLFALQGSHQMDNEYYYRYAQTLKAIRDYKKADSIGVLFAAKEAMDLRTLHFKRQLDYLSDIDKNSGRYTIKLTDVNSSSSDFGATLYQNQLIFSSSRELVGFSKNTHTWTNARFTSLFSAIPTEDGSFTKPKVFAKELQSKFNESTPVFTKDGKTVYFTRNNYANGKRQTNKQGTTLLKIFQATLVKGKWTNIVELPFNSDAFSSAHPALSVENDWMYFASDREGGSGQSDLYRVAIYEDGTFGEPHNLGPQINTPGRESFPVITAEGELYFATDGFPGLGGLDIYGTKINLDGTFTEVQNIGAPVNSPVDDFGYYIDVTTRTGFFTSNREGNDNIYSFIEKEKMNLSCFQAIQGRVYDLPTSGNLEGVLVGLYDAELDKTIEAITDKDGNFSFENLLCGSKYRVIAQLEGYNAAEVAVVLPNIEGSTQTDFGLEKNRVIVKQGDDLFKVLKLNPIYFDFNKAEIRSDAALELAKIVASLKEYPLMSIDVRAHTDSRGKDEYNLKLSDARAKATAKWIVEQGIDSTRVTGRGLGETELLNQCSNKANCTEEEHQMNRRSEFIVLKL
ncbi:OmpA family protein [Flavobacterium sp. JP2137]|uniref:OmpA family protein n=1 Tax=Flavobacterium sp. JP2137 TaxID=3414510 RepID=UPI003D2FCC4E